MQTSDYLNRPLRTIEQAVKDVLPEDQQAKFATARRFGLDSISALMIARPCNSWYGAPFVTYETKRDFNHG